MNNIFNIIVFASLMLPFTKHAIHMFQQNRYEFYRYTKWLFSLKNIHFSYILMYVGMMLVLLFVDMPYKNVVALALTLVFAIVMLYRESKKTYIKPLVYTPRVKRQIVASAVISFLTLFLLVSTEVSLALIGILSVYLPYLLMYVVALVTLPIENAIKKSYENEARDILRKMNHLKIVGITGSFGKTSVKNIVHDILDESYYTLMTPASYNTPMGITRTVREYLKPIHEVFVCEMGADHVGEISYLMDFVKPQYGVVTSIGPQHLNTFHSMENIIKEKMEVIEHLPEDGVGILNLDNEYVANYPIKNNCRLVSVGIHNEAADYVAREILFHQGGSSFEVNIGEKTYHYETCLLGEHNIMNILIALAIAIEMGVSPEKTVDAVSKVKQVEHRLELKKINGFTFIDNAFNSNPVSSKHSLDVLKTMSGTRAIVTPGLIDLGAKEYDYNKEFGRYMKDRADLVLLVGRKQTQAIVDGLKEVGFKEENIRVFDHVKEAFAYVYSHLTYADTILLENDLPDAFSR